MTAIINAPAEAPDALIDAARERGWYVDLDGFIVLFRISARDRYLIDSTPLFSEAVRVHNFRVAVTLSDTEEL